MLPPAEIQQKIFAQVRSFNELVKLNDLTQAKIIGDELTLALEQFPDMKNPIQDIFYKTMAQIDAILSTPNKSEKINSQETPVELPEIPEMVIEINAVKEPESPPIEDNADMPEVTHEYEDHNESQAAEISADIMPIEMGDECCEEIPDPISAEPPKKVTAETSPSDLDSSSVVAAFLEDPPQTEKNRNKSKKDEKTKQSQEKQPKSEKSGIIIFWERLKQIPRVAFGDLVIIGILAGIILWKAPVLPFEWNIALLFVQFVLFLPLLARVIKAKLFAKKMPVESHPALPQPTALPMDDKTVRIALDHAKSLVEIPSTPTKS
jgi:hypothetical protein